MSRFSLPTVLKMEEENGREEGRRGSDRASPRAR